MKFSPSSSSSCSSPLSFHRIGFAPRRRISSTPHRRSPSPLSLFPISPKPTSTSTSSSFFGISLSPKPSKPISSSSYPSRHKRRSLYVVAGVFERFTERAIKAVMFSQREAKALGKDMVFTQHLLLGLIKEDRSPLGFLDSGITIDMARDAVRTIWHDDPTDENSTAVVKAAEVSSATSATDVPFSLSTKRVFEAAVEYSKTMGYNFIAPEHISIGLLTVDDGSAERVLKRFVH